MAILSRHDPVVIAITGSVGKTTVKDAVGHGLSSVAYVRTTEKNYNTDFGVPLTIIGAKNPWGKVSGWFDVILQGVRVLFTDNYPKILVLEVGTRFPGDIKRIARWLRPHISIITHIPEVPVHIEFFGSRQAIVDEKSALAKYTRKDGTIILNRDSQYVYEIAKNSLHAVKSVGFSSQADFFAYDLERIITAEGRYGMKFKINAKGKVINAFVPGLIAKHQIYGTLFAVCAADTLGFDIEQVVLGMATVPFTPGRLNPLLGINDTLILDDSYNASPAAMEAALETLMSIEVPGRHIAVLGDMLDLGKMTKEVHENMGLFLKSQKLDYLVLIGPRMRYAYDLLLNNKYAKTKIYHFDNPTDSLPTMLSLIKKEDVILIKGSQGMRMEKLIAELILDRENISNLLVRQEEKWKNK